MGKYFPGTLPAVAQIQRALKLGRAGSIGELMFRRGEYFQYSLYRKDGSIVSSSQVYPVRDLPEIIRFVIPSKRAGYTVIIHYFNYQGQPGYFYRGDSRFPFYFGEKENKNQPSTALIYIKPKEDGLGRQGARHTARIRAMRSNKPRRTREWTPQSQRRDNTGNSLVAQIPKWNYTNGAGTQGVDTVIAYTRTKGGTVTPNYTKRKKAGTLPINPYSMTLYYCNDGGFVTDAWTDNGSTWQTIGGSYTSQGGSSAYGGGPSGLLSVSTSQDNRAIKKLAEKVGPMNNVAQDLWQVSQLTNMIGDTATRLATSYNNLKKGNLSGAIQNLWHTNVKPRFKQGKHPSPTNSLADNWLALQYGWKPLLQDIHGLMDSIARLKLASVVTYTARSSAHAEDQQVSYMTLGTPGSPKIGAMIQNRTTDVRYGMRYQIDNHLKAFLAQTGFTNPINLAWEVLPYSFVVDWFIPIGPYLESLSAWDGLVFLDGWKSVLQKSSTTWAVGYSGKQYLLDPNDHQMISYLGNMNVVSIAYARTKLTAFPSQSIPTFKNPISGQHALNGLALLNSAFRSR